MLRENQQVNDAVHTPLAAQRMCDRTDALQNTK